MKFLEKYLIINSEINSILVYKKNYFYSYVPSQNKF